MKNKNKYLKPFLEIVELKENVITTSEGKGFNAVLPGDHGVNYDDIFNIG